LSLQDKAKVIREVDKGVQKKKDTAQEFGIPANTLLTGLKNHDAILRASQESHFQPQCKQMKEAKHTDVEEALVKWMKFVRDQNIPLLGPLLQQKAEHSAKELGHFEFQASVGWLDKFKSRHNILFKNAYSKSAVMSDNDYNAWKVGVLPDLVKDYSLDRKFNSAKKVGFIKENIDLHFMAKEDTEMEESNNVKCILTVMVAATMLGTEKFLLLVIGKSRKPHCFRNVKSLLVVYENNKKSWMTSAIYKSWLLKLDRKFNSAKQKVLLFVDNCPAHPKALSTTLKKNLKQKYRKQVILGILCSLEEGQSITISLLDCIKNIDKVRKDVKPMTIAHCFRKAGFTKENIELHFMAKEDTEMEEEEEIEMEESDWLSLQGKLGFPKEVTFDAYVDMDSDVIVSSYPTEEDIL
uniref:HTH CENPB-type domain-containing protein n=1 Tax=Latimeria chalumnae TaxID=7897 RepID=H3A0W5_LATCH